LLTTAQFREFHKAIIGAYTPPELQRLMRFRLGKNVLDYTHLGQDQQQIVFEVIDAAERGGWTDQLILAVREEKPGAPALQIFAQWFELAPKMTVASPSYTQPAAAYPSAHQLQRVVNETLPFLDINVWRKRLGEIEGRVCAVEIANKHIGTGFLVGADLVMTNQHVVDAVIENKVAPAYVALRFDFKRMGDGKIINPGVVYSLAGAGDWLVDYSPYSPLDDGDQFDPDGPASDELDYALLRTAESPGALPIGGDKGDPQAPARGWINVPKQAYDFTAHPALIIVQHPRNSPLMLAIDTQAVIDLNTKGTRVRYRTNTEPGSSGSPVFDFEGRLVALHHRGEPKQQGATWNEGIPFSVIMALLTQRNFNSLFVDY